MHDTAQVVKDLAPYFLSLGAAFWVKRWIVKTDKHIEELLKKVNEMTVTIAILNETKGDGSKHIADLRSRLSHTEDQVNNLSVHVDSIYKLYTDSNMKAVKQ